MVAKNLTEKAKMAKFWKGGEKFDGKYKNGKVLERW